MNYSNNIHLNKINKKAKRIIASFLIIFVILPLISFAIGPRSLPDAKGAEGEIYGQRVYYMFHTYRCVGWTMGGSHTNLKSGICIRPGLFSNYYTAKGKPDFIIVKELHERFIFEREDKIIHNHAISKSESDHYAENKRNVLSCTFRCDGKSVICNDDKMIALLNDLESKEDIFIEHYSRNDIGNGDDDHIVQLCLSYENREQCRNLVISGESVFYQPDTLNDELYYISDIDMNNELLDYLKATELI